MSSKTLPLPPVDYLQQILRATPDGLVWARDRPTDHFRTKKAYLLWRTRCAGRPAQNVRHGRVGRVDIDGRRWMSGRVAWAIANGRDPGERKIIHVDGNRLNDDPCNLALDNSRPGDPLRWASKTACGKWVGAFSMGNKILTFGVYDDPEDARKAVIDARRAMGLTVLETPPKSVSGDRWVKKRWEYSHEGGAWHAGFTVKDQMRWMGPYKTLEAAHAAVIEARRALGLPV